MNDSFLIRITSIRKLQMIGLTVVNQIASDSFVAKDHVWKASTAFIYSFVLSRNQCRNKYTSTPCWTSNRNWDITDSFHQYSEGLRIYKISEVRVRADRGVWPVGVKWEVNGRGGEWTGACGCGCGCEVRGEWRRQGRVALGVDVKWEVNGGDRGVWVWVWGKRWMGGQERVGVGVGMGVKWEMNSVFIVQSKTTIAPRRT